jgi:tetratricopeptide (TPR) repeat protein
MKLSKWLLAALCVAGLVLGAAASAKDKKADEYPDATRKDPKVSMSERDQKNLNKATDLVNEGNGAEAEPLIRKVLDDNKSSKYAQAFAHQLLAQVYWDQEKGEQAISEYKAAIALDALPNDGQFQLIYALAQTQVQEEKYQDALATLAEWEKQTGKQTADELALKANVHYRLDQFQPAIDTMKKAISMTDKVNESWTQILMASYFELDQYDEAAKIVQEQLAKDPNNKKLINQLATIYIQGDKLPQALDVLAKAKSQGLVTTGEDYVQLAKLYANAEKPKEAAATMKEGFAKGVLEGNYDNYKLQGDVCTQAEDDPCAIDGYTKAAPLAKDGNVDYQLGYLLYYSEKSADAVASLDRAITRGGLRQEGEAYLLRGDAKNDLGQDAAALADWRKAAGYPSTKVMADQRIKAATGGVKIKRAKKN